MALYALGDVHLSFETNKPMDIFGGAWSGYVEKLREGLSILQPEDTLVLPGDISWAMDLEHARADFRFLAELPGRKIILKGNHDYWWSTVRKFDRFCAENGFENLFALNNNCYFYGEMAICGTRGWFFEEDRQGTHDEKVFRRELQRLETSLQAAGDVPKRCFLHYPPCYHGYTCPEIISLMQRYGVTHCYYGHLHGASHRLAIQGLVDGIQYQMVSADYVNFKPEKILP